jgi:hypothetical protein
MVSLVPTFKLSRPSRYRMKYFFAGIDQSPFGLAQLPVRLCLAQCFALIDVRAIQEER